MTSTITNYSSNIDVTYPIAGQDNDTAGFRNNFINIVNSLDVAANEISSMQADQSGIISQLNAATVVGTEYAAVIASTVTSLVVNSLTNYQPDIVTPVVELWYNNTITNNLNTLQAEITTNSNHIVALQNSATIFVTNPPLSSTGTVGDKQGMICATTAAIYLCFYNWVGDGANIWAKVPTVGASW